jgi:flavin prenyltransferase
MGRYLVCVTGASGSLYAVRTLRALVEAKQEVHVVASAWGERILNAETGGSSVDWATRIGIPPDRVYNASHMEAFVSSGSFRLDGTIVVPCSMSTVSALASGNVVNLIHRAGAVALKEGWPLIVVPRETPLSLVDLKNLTALAEAGAIVLPACPAFYSKPQTQEDLADFLAGKILDRLGIPNDLYSRWDPRGKE